jgi:hypothetical protein
MGLYLYALGCADYIFIETKGVAVNEENLEVGRPEIPEPEASANLSHHPQIVRTQTANDAERLRAARAKLIEETTYRLTDLLTIISGRIDILSDKVPPTVKQELVAIRAEVKKGVELNERFFLVAQACRREVKS